MHSAEYIALEGVADILRQEGIDPSRMADELAVLVSWASLSHKEHGRLEWNEQQPDLGYAFEQMTESLGEHGRFFSESRFPKHSAK
jgi:type I restriction enzyme M protein